MAVPAIRSDTPNEGKERAEKGSAGCGSHAARPAFAALPIPVIIRHKCVEFLWENIMAVKLSGRDFLVLLTFGIGAAALFLSAKNYLYPRTNGNFQDIYLSYETEIGYRGWVRAYPNATQLLLRSPWVDKTKPSMDVSMESFQDLAGLDVDGKIFIGIINGKPYMGVLSPNRGMFYPVVLGQPVPVGSDGFPHPIWGSKTK